jgi:hypothetical protein
MVAFSHSDLFDYSARKMLHLFHIRIDDKSTLCDHSTSKFHGCGPATNSKYKEGNNGGAQFQMALDRMKWRDGGAVHPTFP